MNRQAIKYLLWALIAPVCAAESATPGAAHFSSFEYQAAGELVQPGEGMFANPILPGFYPDPSITRRGDHYYLVTSSFAYTPGLPIFKSDNLVNWELVGHALNRSEQVSFEGLRTSRGIFAPTLRYHDGLFYLITTAVDAGGNFIITAKDPAGPWSEPVWLPEVGGIDPDLFIDDDGRAFIAHNDAPPGEPQYDGHRAVWMWELDLASLKVKKGTRTLLINGGVDISTQPVWIEGPHIYKVNGWYYLTCAEGGTSVNHSQVVFRTRSLAEPFIPYPGNPILTQRDRPQSDITSTGHADFIQTPKGQWYSVFLATRPYQGNHYNTGRETFMLPLSWDDNWPTILAPGKPVPLEVPLPEGAAPGDNTFASRSARFTDTFSGNKLNPQWLALNTFDRSWLALTGDGLALTPTTRSLHNAAQSAFIGKRQQHSAFNATTTLTSLADNTEAGLVMFQNRQFHYFLGVRQANGVQQVFLEKVENGKATELAVMSLGKTPGDVTLFVEGQGADLRFYLQTDDQKMQVGKAQPATLVSTQTAGGFVGALIALHARQKGEAQ